MDDRDRRAPVTLARDAPVAQPPHRRPLAPAFAFGAMDDLAHRFRGLEPVEKAAVDQAAGTRIGLVADRNIALFRGHGAYARARPAIFPGEIEGSTQESGRG